MVMVMMVVVMVVLAVKMLIYDNLTNIKKITLL